MRVLVALDKFKEALSANEACQAAREGLRSVHPAWTFDECPLTDGGDGFVAALAKGKAARLLTTRVPGPLGEPVEAAWALVPADQIPAAARKRLGLAAEMPLAVLEMAACSGLALVPREHRDVWRSTSRGVGELISAAASAGAGAILLGVGGSATNDLGLGALAALGHRFLDSREHLVTHPSPSTWSKIVRIVPPDPPPRRLPPVWIACDVANPLLGPTGATQTYGPQKGLAREQAPALDTEMRRIATLLAAAHGLSLEHIDRPGAGAAGGITAGLAAALGARSLPGFDFVAEWLDLERRVAAADLVVTGEGRFDTTSLQGKGPGGLARLALASGKRTLVLAGSTDLPNPPPGLELLAITPSTMPLAEALPRTAELLQRAAALAASP